MSQSISRLFAANVPPRNAAGEHIPQSWPGEYLLGTFPTRREAPNAVSAAARQALLDTAGRRDGDAR
jgi:hypothetical protein